VLRPDNGYSDLAIVMSISGGWAVVETNSGKAVNTRTLRGLELQQAMMIAVDLDMLNILWDSLVAIAKRKDKINSVIERALAKHVRH
jgi:hypothetical protein